jgi:hypothetical protein
MSILELGLSRAVLLFGEHKLQVDKLFSSNGAFGKRSKSKAITVQVLDACGINPT